MSDAVLRRLGDHLARLQPGQATEPDRPRAAVALLLAPDPDRLLLIHRAEREGDPWSGHLALPGGRREPGDADLLQTAIRETTEETGIILPREWCMAQLDDLVPRTPSRRPMVVRPFVFVLPVVMAAGVSAEVVRSIWVPIAELAREDALATRTIDVRGVPLEVQGYLVGDGFLWGMTERIVTPMLRLWKEESAE